MKCIHKCNLKAPTFGKQQDKHILHLLEMTDPVANPNSAARNLIVRAVIEIEQQVAV